MVEFLIGVGSSLTATVLSKINLRKLLSDPRVKFWDPYLRPSLTIVVAGEDPEKKVKAIIWDFNAIQLIEDQVFKPYLYKYTRNTSDLVTREELRGNLLLVGGPKSNHVTKHIFTRKLGVLNYSFSVNRLVDSKREFEKTAIFQPGGKHPTTDFGIISSISNPFNINSRVLIASGCYAWGTYGALCALTAPANLVQLLKIPSQQEFQVLIEVGVFNKSPEEPKVLWETMRYLTS